MLLTTPVNITPSAFTLDTESRVMLIGSCFAEHVGEHLLCELNEGMVDVNPFGVLYNPISIAQALRLLMSDDGRDEAVARVFLGQDGVWHSWLHTTYFSGSTREECQQKILARYDASREFLRNASMLCITFGTTRCYKLQDGEVVANCHKEPQQCFTEYEASLGELSALWHDVMTELRRFNPGVRVCLTVSPYRYRKYGFHESQIQKAKLLLLTDALCSKDAADGSCMYFPAYEIMMDELRDYRFYANDMLHPSDLAVEIIYDRFKDWVFSDRLRELSAQNKKAWKRKAHRANLCK